MINYYLLIKPGIILGNLITLAAGFFLASRGKIDPWLFLATFLGLACIIASACVFNNYIDRNLDKKMDRTKNRALATGIISAYKAIFMAIALGIAGVLILIIYTNLLATLIAAIGFCIYVFLYTLWKRHSLYGTAIGSIAGAIPPVVGYCAAGNRLDLGAYILFALLVLWQMPHFFSIAMRHLDDYIKAEIPVLPVKKGEQITKIHMLFYIIAFLFVAPSLTFFHYTGYAYLIATLALGIAWLGLCLKGFNSTNNEIWGRQMFQLSLLTIMVTCALISIDGNHG